MIIDLHTHTRPMSDDSYLEPAQLIQRAKGAGLDGVCFTEHDCCWDNEATARLSHEHDFLVLAGVEISVESWHILVFGVEKDSITNGDIITLDGAEHLRRVVDKAGGFMLMAHPYRKQNYVDSDFEATIDDFSRKPILQLVDGVEALNSRSSETGNRFSQELCRRLNFKGTGGSDAHFILDIPTCATQFERNIRNLEELITELKAGRFMAVDLRQNQSQ